MIRRALVTSSLLFAFACSMGEATRPDLSPIETSGIQGKGGRKPLPVPLGGLQFTQAPAQPGSYATLSFVQNGTFAGALVVSCADGPCAHPNLAQVSGTWDQDGKSYDVHLELTQVTVAPGTAIACKNVQHVVDLHKDDETLDQVPGKYLSITGKNLCGGTDFALFQASAGVVGAGGGTVSTPDGASIALPPGAVTGNTTITFAQAPTAPTPGFTTSVGIPYVAGPEGTRFATPVTMTLPVDPATIPGGKTIADLRIFTAALGSTRFHALQTSVVDSTHVAAPASHFSIFVTAFAADCSSQIAAMTSSPVKPPNIVGDVDLSQPDDSGGPVTIDDLDPTGSCLVYQASPSPTGVATDGWATIGTSGQLAISYDQSRVVDFFQEFPGYTGTVTFNSRDGAYQYQIGLTGSSIGAAFTKTTLPGGPTVPFTIDWNDPTHAAVNEIYDAMMATFAPAVVPIGGDCVTRSALTPWSDRNGPACRFSDDGTGNNGNWGTRVLRFYVDFSTGTTPADMYTFWSGVQNVYTSNCASVSANLGAMDNSAIRVPGGDRAPGATIAGIMLANVKYDDFLTQQWFCDNPQDVAAPDGASYGARTWGPSGEIELEYNLASRIGYKLIATSGYSGTVTSSLYDPTFTTITDNYTLGVGVFTDTDGSGVTTPITIDWTDASHTTISNFIDSFYWHAPQGDCAAQGFCTIAQPGGSGTDWLVTFPPFAPGHMTIVFPANGGPPTKVEAVWPAGQ